MLRFDHSTIQLGVAVADPPGLTSEVERRSSFEIQATFRGASPTTSFPVTTTRWPNLPVHPLPSAPLWTCHSGWSAGYSGLRSNSSLSSRLSHSYHTFFLLRWSYGRSRLGIWPVTAQVRLVLGRMTPSM